MNLMNIRKGFYTDGEKIYSNECGAVCVWLPCREESEHFLASGNVPARIFEHKDVKPVKAGMVFCDGQIKVIDKNTIKMVDMDRINACYDEKGYCKCEGYETVQRIYRN